MAKKKIQTGTKKYLLFLIVFLAGLLMGIFSQIKKDANQPSMSTHTKPQAIKFTQEIPISELGITIKVPEEVKDVVYEFDGNSAGLSTTSLVNLSTDCAPGERPLGSLVKYDKSGPFPYDGNEQTIKNLTYSRLDEGYSDEIVGPSVKEFDSFYITYEGPQSHVHLWRIQTL